MKPLRHLIFMVLFAAPFSLWAQNCSTAGIDLPQRLALAGAQAVPLTLNGAGARTKYLWDVYVGALYLPAVSASAQAVLDMPGPKRLWLHFVHDVSAAKLAEGWREGFEDNNDAAQLAGLQERLDRSYGMFRDMKAGESIALDYLPGTGTRLWMNGVPGAVITGPDFYRAVLKIWLGDRPAQATLKECLLGGQGG